MCLSSVRGREAQFTACEGFTSHHELACGQFRSPDRKPAFSPSPSLTPISSTAPRAGASAWAGPGPTPAAPRPGGDLRQLMVKRHASQAPARCGLMSYKVAKPSSGPPEPSGMPSWLHLLLVLRRPTCCENGGAAGMGWPPRGCSLERLQDGVLGVQRNPREGCAGRHDVYL